MVNLVNGPASEPSLNRDKEHKSHTTKGGLGMGKLLPTKKAVVAVENKGHNAISRFRLLDFKSSDVATTEDKKTTSSDGIVFYIADFAHFGAR